MKNQRTKINILLLILSTLLFSVTSIASASFATSTFSTEILLVAEETNSYLIKNKLDKTYARIEKKDNGRETYYLRDYVKSMVYGGKHVVNNKMYYFSSPKEGLIPLQIELPNSNKTITPKILLMPYQDVGQTFFKFKLMENQTWYQNNMSVVAHNLFITKHLADKIIDENELLINNYSQLINYPLPAKYNNGNMIGSRNFNIAGVIDSDVPEFAFYKEAFGEDLCVGPFISQNNYYGNVSIVFEMGLNKNETISFLKAAKKRIKEDFSLLFYEKVGNYYAQGHIMESYLHGLYYFGSPQNNYQSIAFFFLLVLGLIGIVITTGLFTSLNYENKKLIQHFSFYIPAFILLLQLLLSPLFHFSKGLNLSNGFYMPNNNPYAIIVALTIMVLSIFVALISEKVVLIKKVEKQK